MIDLKHYIGRHIANFQGYRTDRKIVVIESDDWGAIRTPNLETRYRLIEKGILFSSSKFEYVDTLANSEDFDALFSLLSKFKDSKGNNPKITANVVLTNPDFTKIKNSNYSEYYYEPFTETLNRYYPNEAVFDYWKEGMDKKLFFPQFHAREHINAELWMNFLRIDDTVRLAAEYGFCAPWIKSDPSVKFLQAFNVRSEKEKKYVMESIESGLHMFYEIFGFKSVSFIAPSYIWDSYIEDCLWKNQIYFIQGMKGQKTSILEGSKLIKHNMGEKNRNGQYYLCRNVFFEPSLGNVDKQLKQAIDDIRIAFHWKKPVIISMHRLNFIGSLEKKNRETSLFCLDRLLQCILDFYPDVEFLTTAELGSLISKR